MERELERAFFVEAGVKGTRKTSFTATTALDRFEEFVQGIENTQNDFVDGVDRDMIHVVMNTSTYGDCFTGTSVVLWNTELLFEEGRIVTGKQIGRAHV